MDKALKTKIDSLWQFLWDNGMANPLTNLQQITYLLFIKLLDDRQIIDEQKINSLRTIDPSIKLENPVFPDGNYVDTTENINVPFADLRWSQFKEWGSPQRVYDNMRRNVFPFIKKLKNEKSSFFSKFMEKANFEVSTPALLDGMIQRLSDPVFDLTRSDVIGDCYEILLSRMSMSGELGQFRTPRHIIDMMIELAQPTLKDKVLDPAMGTAGFLIETATYIREHYASELMQRENNYHYHNEMFTGYDIDKDMVAFGSMNVTLHGIENPDIQQRSSLSSDFTDKNKYSLVLANPPFTGSLDASDISPTLKSISGGTKKTELLFLALFLRVLQVGGRCVSIVPAGVINNTNAKAYTSLRKEIIDNQKLEFIVYLPQGVFQPYSPVETAIIGFTKTNSGGTDRVWLYNVESVGVSLDQKVIEISENDIPDVIERFHHLDQEEARTKQDKSFFITKQDIVDNNYVLSFNLYREKESQIIDYPPALEILANIHNLERDVAKTLSELDELLSFMNDAEM